MVIDYDSEVFQKGEEENPNEWKDLPDMIRAGKIYAALDLVNRSLEGVKPADEIRYRLLFARILEESCGQFADYALDQFEAVLAKDSTNVEALAGKARLAADEEIEASLKKEAVQEPDEEEQILRDIARMPQLPRAKKVEICLGASLLIWGSGLLFLKRKTGFIFLAYQFLVVLFILSDAKRKALVEYFWSGFSLSTMKLFSYEATQFSHLLFGVLAVVGLALFAYSLYVTHLALRRHNQGGAVVRLDRDRLFINLGENRRVKPGQHFNVFKIGTFKDEDGRSRSEEFGIGRMRIDIVQEVYSIGTFLGFRGEMVNLPGPGDRVEPV